MIPVKFVAGSADLWRARAPSRPGAGGVAMLGPRESGLLFMLLGAAVFGGTNLGVLPPAAFFAGLLLAALGLVRFMKGNRAASAREERRLQRSLHPDITRHAGRAHAGAQARRPEDLGISALDGPERHRAEAIGASEAEAEEVVLYEVDDPGAKTLHEDFKVSTDVSFPLEVQEERSISEEIAKLTRLRDDGILSDEEFHAAKAKLLG